jgi:signal transduction histidine kinase/CheY-like chemotaxis protein/ligand-binding sensor domain-containing protein/AraC-like DNA-binding protein
MTSQTKHLQMRFKLFIIWAILPFMAIFASNTKFYSINTRYGISVRETYSICEDNNGFIWTASKTGILRLTENDYKLYSLPFKAAGFINVRLLYSNKHLYAYTFNGQVYYYNPIKDKFVFLLNMQELMHNNFSYVHDMKEDKRGGLWLATSVGLYHYANGIAQRVGNSKKEVIRIVWYDSDHLIVSNAKSVSLVDINTRVFRYLVDNVEENRFTVSRLYYDKSQKKLWIGTDANGLFQYEFKTGLFSKVQIPSLPNKPILAITPNSDSTLLIGIDGQGLWKIERKAPNKVISIHKNDADDPFSLPGNGIYDIICDKNNRVWVATFSSGVSFYEQTPPHIQQIFHTINKSNSLCDNYINKIIEDSRGNIWFATNNGISQWNVKTDQWRSYYHNKDGQAVVFLSICEDNLGRIWAGTYASGVYLLDGKSGKEIAHYMEGNNPIINSNFIFSITKDSQGDIWIGGTRSQIAYFNVKTKEIHTYPEKSLNPLMELSPGKMLFDCPDGLLLLDKQTGKEKLLLNHCLVHDIAVCDGKIWAGTKGSGLISYDLKNGTTRYFTMKSGLPSNYINGIMAVNGYLWLGTEAGLCKFNLKTEKVFTYESILPFSNISFNVNAHCRLKNGELLWGTVNGAILFNPNIIRDIKTRGVFYFEDLSVSGRSIKDNPGFHLATPLNNLQKLQLNYDQNTITLELLSLGVNASDSKFSWLLEGFDSEWRLPVNQRIITYTNLPSGRYKLKIRMYDSSASHIIAERTLTISITPPVWRKWWFISLLGCIIVSILYLLLRYYINYLNQQQTEEKIKFFANTAHEIRTSLTLITGPIEELNKGTVSIPVRKYYLHLALEQARRLSNVVTRLMDFQKLDVGKEQLSLQRVDIVKMINLQKMMYESLAANKRIKIILQSNQSSCYCDIDEMMIEKVISNLISNAIKYAYADTEISLKINCLPDKWIFTIKDQGIGISKKGQQQLFNEFYRDKNAINSKAIGSGIGLLMAKQYVLLHGGDITCESEENVGSTFQVAIPYKDITEMPSFSKIPDQMQSPVEEEDQDIQEEESNRKHKKMKILVVDDNYDLRNFMKMALRTEFEVDMAEDGRQAWQMIQKAMPDLVVSDVMMPNMDGWELCRLLKSSYQTSHIPIILLTALSEQAEELRGIGLGADDYLKKPFDVSLLLQRIKTIVRNREIIKEKTLKLVAGNNDISIVENENNDKFIKKALSIVNENMTESGFGKDEFASAMNISTSVLYRKLKSLTDLSPVDFIKTIRLNHAVELLKSGKYSITEVSELCGFTSLAYFSKVFRKHFGKSPTDILND